MIHWFCPNGDIWVCGVWCVHMTGSIVIDREGRTPLFHPELVLPEMWNNIAQMKRQTKIISPCHGTRFLCTRIFICLKSRRWQGVLKVGSGLYAGTRTWAWEDPVQVPSPQPAAPHFSKYWIFPSCDTTQLFLGPIIREYSVSKLVLYIFTLNSSQENGTELGVCVCVKCRWHYLSTLSIYLHYLHYLYIYTI